MNVSGVAMQDDVVLAAACRVLHGGRPADACTAIGHRIVLLRSPGLVPCVLPVTALYGEVRGHTQSTAGRGRGSTF